MKLWAGIAIGCSVLFSEGEMKRPEAFFTPDNLVRYSTYTYPKKGSGTKSSLELSIAGLTNKNGRSHSTATLIKYNRYGALYGKYPMEFASDSVCFYVHAANYACLLMDFGAGTSEYSGDSLWYPLRMNIQDTLPGAWATRKVTASLYSTDFRVDFFSRKVTGTDTLDTPFGKVLAWRIEMSVRKVENNEVQNGHRSTKKDVMEITEWFVPAIGIVKAEINDKKFGLTRLVMDSYTK